MPTLQQLRYLAALAETLHFRRAAEECHVTQPTLSAQVKELEARLGTVLVERGHGSVVLTPAGREIAARARLVLREVAEIVALARAAGREPLSGTLRLGVVQSLGSYLMPHLVPDLRRRFPDLRLYLREGLPKALLGQLADGALDLLAFPLPVSERDTEAARLFREPLLLVAPSDHALARRSSVAPADLRGETILALEPGHQLYNQVRDLCAAIGAELSHDYEGTSLDTLRQMVAMGMGLSLLPALYVRSEVARETLVAARPLDGPTPARVIGLVWRRGSVRGEAYGTLAAAIRDILRARVPEVTVLD
ncbi:MAG: LysR substrate-binding domain-containing protein [Rhodobacteraceae bacterium]|jgi:LysR family hydrogen peroxide-inducible transcriptional activator|nr:LysR substrate-binding domain-containing protein [Paracoccaceae bacterium]